ncbi:hypothetical protein HW555_012972 [Spodoptera exigua]|uniref:Uncharacterized protein n=1 Tax=Spodoptera exigua TaxID=7107 RepID=A0A835G2I3_SPOEX|nr:hypothetical protein HW555_012972 [Spodoptera exigua]
MFAAFNIMATADDRYVNYITESPGMIYDPVGTVKIISDQFRIVIPIDVSPFNEYIENVHDILNIIQNQCRQNEEIDYSLCQNMLQPLESLFKDLRRDYNSISHIVSNNPKRRSAWFSGIGVVFKHIFGTLDEDDAENYNKAIRTINTIDAIALATLTPLDTKVLECTKSEKSRITGKSEYLPDDITLDSPTHPNAYSTL